MSYSYTITLENGDTLDTEDVFDSYEEAEEAALYDISCYNLGGEIFHMSNPGDYAEPEDEEFEIDIFEVK